jgi:hypothetical protein
MMQSSPKHRVSFRLRLEVLVWRHGWGWLLLAVLAILFLTAELLVLPKLTQQVESHRKQLQQLQLEQSNLSRTIDAPFKPTGDKKILDQLSSVSIPESEVSEVLRKIAAMAERNGVVLSQSDYQNSSKGHGGLNRLQVTLPLRASYPQLKQFIEQVLFEFPGVSLDDLVLKRESVSQNQVEIRIKLSLWIQP